MSEEEKNSSNIPENTISSQSNSTDATTAKVASQNTNFAIPGNVLSEMYANYNSALRGAKGLPLDLNYIKAASRMSELASQNLKGLGLASLNSTSNAYKNIASMQLPDRNSYALAAKILSGIPSHNDKVAERLKKICEPSLTAGKILSEFASKSDWANNAVGKNLLKYDITNITNSFNSSAISDIIKRNENLSKQFSATPVAGYYRDLLKRGDILSQLQKSLDLCNTSQKPLSQSSLKLCVEALRKTCTQLENSRFDVPKNQLELIKKQLNTLENTSPTASFPLKRTFSMEWEATVMAFVPVFEKIIDPLQEFWQVLGAEIKLRLSTTEEVLRSQLEITEKLLNASQLTHRNVEALIAETQKNNSEIEELLDISKNNAATIEKQLATAEKNGATVKELLDASQNNFNASKVDAKTNKILSWIAIGIAVAGIITQVIFSCRAERNDRTGEVIEAIKQSSQWSSSKISADDAKNVSVAFHAITEALQKNVQLEKETDRLQDDLSKAQGDLAALQKQYDASAANFLHEKQKLYAEISALKKQIEELKAELAKRPVPSPASTQEDKK